MDVGPATAPTWPADPAAVAGAVVVADDAQDADAAARVNLRAAFVADAAARGAVAVVLLPPTWPTRAGLRPRPSDWFPRRYDPAAAHHGRVRAGRRVAQVQKRLIREDLAVRPLRLAISTTAHLGLTSHNVFGDLRGRSGRAARSSTSPGTTTR